MTDLWPWPADTSCERARRIANSLLAQLPTKDRDVAIRKARAVGETWLGEHLLSWDVNDLVTTNQAAEILHVKPSTIRQWHSRGYLPHHRRKGYYLLAQVLDCAAARRRAREAT